MPAKRPDPTDVTVGRNIRAHRLARGLSQSALADRIGVSYQQVQKHERGENHVGASRLTRIADVLGVPVAALFDGVVTGATATQAPVLHLLAEKDAMRLVQAFARIKDGKLRWLIVGLVEDVAEVRARD
jgi:transcriptional regulator with XRE-family HTH domain